MVVSCNVSRKETIARLQSNWPQYRSSAFSLPTPLPELEQGAISIWETNMMATLVLALAPKMVLPVELPGCQAHRS